jgi:hypothetical protein
MSERYLITGVQLGTLQVIEGNDRINLIDKITNEQFIGNSKKNIKEDVKTCEVIKWT